MNDLRRMAEEGIRADAQPDRNPGLGRTGTDPLPDDPDGLMCSGKGCTKPAAWDLQWNNPSIHTPDRRKHWLACAEHRDSLGAFLSARGFLRDTLPLDAS